MRRKLIIAAVMLVILMLMLCRYILIEQHDTLPDDVLLGWLPGYSIADAETEPPVTISPTSTP